MVALHHVFQRIWQKCKSLRVLGMNSMQPRLPDGVVDIPEASQAEQAPNVAMRGLSSIVQSEKYDGCWSE